MMRNLTKNTLLMWVICGFPIVQGCVDILDEENKSQLAAENLLTSRLGMEIVIADAYSQINLSNNIRNLIKREEMTTDILLQSGGGAAGAAVPLMEFRWDSNNNLETMDWGSYWNAIRNANTILDNIDRLAEISEGVRLSLTAEARFLRIWAYYTLWNQYGSLPIRTSLLDPREMARTSDEEFTIFMESELVDVILHLPEPGNEPNYGRVHSDGARALLCSWYLNNKKWKECADVALEIMNRGNFELFPSIFDLFALENERNNEFILVKTHLANTSNSLTIVAPSLPPGYYEGLDGGLKGVVNRTWANFASQFRLYDEFYYSFEPGDIRRDRILTRFINSNGVEVNLLTGTNNTRGMKYQPDPNTQGAQHGNDVPFIRYAEILLSRAEALNELDGPNQESVDLINLIRNRAGLNDISMASYDSKEGLRDHIMDERRWEFWYEGKRRTDLLRVGKYIQSARDRGANAEDKHKLFPIPQTEIDANNLFNQNPGY